MTATTILIVYSIFCVLTYARQRAMLHNRNIVLNSSWFFIAILDILVFNILSFIAYTIYYLLYEKNQAFLKF